MLASNSALQYKEDYGNSRMYQVLVKMSEILHKDSILSSQRMVVNIKKEDEDIFYSKLQFHLSKVTKDVNVVCRIILLLKAAGIVDLIEVEGKSMQGLIELFHSKPKPVIIKFLNTLCNLEGLPSTSKLFRDAINEAIPGTVVPVNITSHLLYSNFSGVQNTTPNLMASPTENDSGFTGPCDGVISLNEQGGVPITYEFSDISTIMDKKCLECQCPVDIYHNPRNINGKNMSMENDTVDVEGSRHHDTSCRISNPNDFRLKFWPKIFVYICLVLCSSIGGASVYRYLSTENDIRRVESPVLSSHLPIDNGFSESTSVSTSNADIIRYDRVLDNGLKQYRFERHRPKEYRTMT